MVGDYFKIKTIAIVSFMLCITLSSLLIPAILVLGKQDIYKDDKKLVDKYHLIRKEKEKCKSSSSQCRTVKPVDKDEDDKDFIANSVQNSTTRSVDEIKAKADSHSRNKTTFRSQSDKPVQSSSNTHALCPISSYLSHHNNQLTTDNLHIYNYPHIYFNISHIQNSENQFDHGK
jgi:hypothetical protein